MYKEVYGLNEIFLQLTFSQKITLYSFNYYPKIYIDMIDELTASTNNLMIKASTNSQMSVS